MLLLMLLLLQIVGVVLRLQMWGYLIWLGDGSVTRGLSVIISSLPSSANRSCVRCTATCTISVCVRPLLLLLPWLF